MDVDTALVVILSLAFIAAIFFWGRGLIRCRKGDLAAGVCVLAVVCMVLGATATSTAVFSLIGLLVIGFGLATMILSSFAPADCPIVKSNRLALGAGAVIMGLFLQIIL